MGTDTRDLTVTTVVDAQPEVLPGLPRAAFPPFAVGDGRYLGTSGRWWADLRVDCRGSGAISLDLHAIGTVAGDGAATVVAMSARTPFGSNPCADDGRWHVRWTAGPVPAGAEQSTGPVHGWLAIRPVTDLPGRIELRAHLSADLAGVRAQTVTVRLTRTSDSLRELGIEVDIEEGVVPPRPVVVDGEPTDLTRCIERAGFAVTAAGVSGLVTPPEGGRWGAVDVVRELSEAMTRNSQTSFSSPAWEAQLLLLSRSTRPGLLGLMFDYTDDLPRQGAAVFVDEIRDHAAAEGADAQEADRSVLRSVVHELGHVLNLVHRFEAGRWDSRSVMNYDWVYRGGGHADEYRREHRFEFDGEEVDFLRHADWWALVPGGAPFGTQEYWLHEPGAEVPVVDAEQLRLWLTPPPGLARQDGGYDVPAGQPVFLTVSLANVDGDSVVVPRHALDVKSGHLQLLITRADVPVRELLTDPSEVRRASFSPILRRCWDVSRPRLVRLDCGQSLHDNVNLALESGGVPMTEPGTYVVTPVLTLPSGRPDTGVIRVAGRGVTLHVGAGIVPVALPRTVDARIRKAVALGTGDLDARTRDAVAEYSDRVRTSAARAGDPVMDRVSGLDKWREARAAAALANDPRAGQEAYQDAARLLKDAMDTGQAVFDPHTREHTRRLGERAEVAAGEAGAVAPPRVIVDMATPSPSGNGSPASARLAGTLVVDEDGQGFAVLAPAETLPAGLRHDGTAVEVAVHVTGDDGLSESVTVARVDIVGRQQAELVLLWLSRSVPGESSPPIPEEDLKAMAAAENSGLWEQLAERGFVDDTGQDSGVPVTWSEAVTSPRADLADLSTRTVTTTVTLDPRVLGINWLHCALGITCRDQVPEGRPYPFPYDHPFDVAACGGAHAPDPGRTGSA